LANQLPMYFNEGQIKSVYMNKLGKKKKPRLVDPLKMTCKRDSIDNPLHTNAAIEDETLMLIHIASDYSPKKVNELHSA